MANYLTLFDKASNEAVSLVNSRIVSLEMDLHSCKQDYDKLTEEHNALLAKVEDYNANAELNECRMVIGHLTNQIEDLEEENDKLFSELQTANWNYECAQSELRTMVAKSINFSYKNVKRLENTDKEINLRVVMVNPFGQTSVVITNESVFRNMIEDDDRDDTIIYERI
jgi:chromosome segregation ATPase